MKYILTLLTALLLAPLAAVHAADRRPVYVVPNFHPASCGWLTDWSTERNYCANSYFDHLDRVRDDANYSFALSECNNMIAMLNFRPDRAAELRQRIREGRVDLCNAFFLEPTINLYNAAEKYRGYPNAWLSGAGRHVVRYALAAHEGDFAEAQVPQMAWEFNDPPLEAGGCAAVESPAILQTSDNVIVEALRREGGEIELRLAECLGRAGEASVTLNLPHLDAALTDMLGCHRQPLRGGPTYTFPVRPQQIVTMRFKTADAVSAVKPLTEWDELVPENKREALRRYLPDVKGHPPAGGQ